jgi:hypothetical protein
MSDKKEDTRLSELQKKIIKYLENQINNTDSKPNIVKEISKDSHKKSTILKSIKRLEIKRKKLEGRGVLIPSKTRSIYSESSLVKKQHRPQTVALNTKSIIYKKYKERLQNK